MIRKDYSCNINRKFNDFTLYELTMLTLREEPYLKKPNLGQPIHPEELENIIFRYQFFGKSWEEIRKTFLDHLSVCGVCNDIYKEYKVFVKREAEKIIGNFNNQGEQVINEVNKILNFQTH